MSEFVDTLSRREMSWLMRSLIAFLVSEFFGSRWEGVGISKLVVVLLVFLGICGLFFLGIFFILRRLLSYLVFRS